MHQHTLSVVLALLSEQPLQYSACCMIFTLYYYSEKAVFDNKKAIRGGVPIIFRQFICSFSSTICSHYNIGIQLSLVAGSLDLNMDLVEFANGSYYRSQQRLDMRDDYNRVQSLLL